VTYLQTPSCPSQVDEEATNPVCRLPGLNEIGREQTHRLFSKVKSVFRYCEQGKVSLLNYSRVRFRFRNTWCFHALTKLFFTPRQAYFAYWSRASTRKGRVAIRWPEGTHFWCST
jgi:hypothetical protein